MKVRCRLRPCNAWLTAKTWHGGEGHGIKNGWRAVAERCSGDIMSMSANFSSWKRHNFFFQFLVIVSFFIFQLVAGCF